MQGSARRLVDRLRSRRPPSTLPDPATAPGRGGVRAFIAEIRGRMAAGEHVGPQVPATTGRPGEQDVPEWRATTLER